MKKMLAVLLVVVFMLSCASVSLATEKTTLTVWYDGSEEPTALQLEAEYEALHPEIDVVFETVAYADMATKEMIVCRSSVGPDVMMQSIPWTNSFAQMGLLTAFNDYLADSTVDVEKDFEAAALTLATVDDKLYALPWKVEAMGLLYNKTMFAEAGLDPEAPPATWAEVLEYSEKLTKDLNGDGIIDQYGFGLVGNATGNCWFRFVPELWNAGGDVTNAEMTEATLNTPEAMEALTYYAVDLAKYAPEGATNNSATETRTLFGNGKVAMYIDGLPGVRLVQGEAPELDIGVGLWPGKDGYTNAGLGGWYVTIPHNAQNPDAAWDFVEHFVSKDVQEYYPTAFPGNISARSAERFSDSYSLWQAEQLSHIRCFLPLNDVPSAQEIVMNMIQNVLSGMMTVEEALEDANTQMNDVLNQ